MGKQKQVFRKGNILYNTVGNYFCIYIQKHTNYNHHYILQLDGENIIGMCVVKSSELVLPTSIPDYLNYLIN